MRGKSFLELSAARGPLRASQKSAEYFCNFRGIAGASGFMESCVAMEPAPFSRLIRVAGYILLGGGTFVGVVILASLLQGDLAKAWAAQVRRLRRNKL